MIGPESTIIDVAFAASTALAELDVVAVLCGGTAATFYCDSYQSLDVDLVLASYARSETIDAAIASIGFDRLASGMYRHPGSRFTIEFPAGPIAIGRKLVTTWRTIDRGTERLCVLEPEDVVCDRFLHFWAWGDRSARTVALDVARKASAIDIRALETWATREMALDALYDRASWEAFRHDLSP